MAGRLQKPVVVLEECDLVTSARLENLRYYTLSDSVRNAAVAALACIASTKHSFSDVDLFMCISRFSYIGLD